MVQWGQVWESTGGQRQQQRGVRVPTLKGTSHEKPADGQNYPLHPTRNDAHILIPRTGECVTLQGGTHFADMKVKNLEARFSWILHYGPVSGSIKDTGRSYKSQIQRSEDALLSAHRGENASSPGMWAVARSQRDKKWILF